MSGTPLGIKVPTFMAILLSMAQDTTIRGGWAPRTIPHRSRGGLHRSMTPFITVGVLAGAMGQALRPVFSGGSRWESSLHRGGMAVIGQVGIPGMAMVTGTDTPGVTVMAIMGMDGIPDITITRMMDIVAVMTGIKIHIGCISIPTSIVLLTPSGQATEQTEPDPGQHGSRTIKEVEILFINNQAKDPLRNPTRIPSGHRKT